MTSAAYDDITLLNSRMKSYFPHNSRLFAARMLSFFVNCVLWSLLLLLFAINIYAGINSVPIYWNQIVTAIRLPYSLDIHQSVAQTFWNNGLFQSAKSELAYLRTLSSLPPVNANVLGEQNQQGELSLPGTKNESIQKDYDRWHEIVTQKTDYRDGFLILSALSYQRNQLTQARAYAEQAFVLDPTSLLANKLLLLTKGK